MAMHASAEAPVFHGTTIVSVRRGRSVALGGDGQVTLGNTIVKSSARKVRTLYRDQVLCPHLRRGIGAEECRSFAAAPMSTSNPEKLRHWEACRRCPLNPKGEPK